MLLARALLFASGMVAAACSNQAAPPASTISMQSVAADAESPSDGAKRGFAAHVGRQLVVDGSAANAKLGALLQTDRGVLWIDGLDSWPPGFYEGEGRAKRLRVTGILIERADLPVFVPQPGEPQMQGIPVPAGTDLEKASKRYLLKNATWVELP